MGYGGRSVYEWSGQGQGELGYRRERAFTCPRKPAKMFFFWSFDRLSDVSFQLLLYFSFRDFLYEVFR